MTVRTGHDWMPERPAAVRNLTIDAMSGRVVTALRDGGVSSLLLKGPVIANRLYRRDEVRPYADCDLLVRRGDLTRAEAIVAELGMRQDTVTDRFVPAWQRHHSQWQLRERHFDLELHWTLIHMGADPDTVWEVCNRDSGTLQVGGVEVTVPCDAQLALNLMLHAAQHGPAWPRSQEDMARAIATFAPEAWRAAADRAVQLDAMPGFAAGLRLSEAGATLAATLDLPDAPTYEVMLTTGRAGEHSLEIDHFVRAPGPVAKARLAISVAFPPPAVVRAKHLAGRSGRGLARAYLMQWVSVTRKAAVGVRNWRRSRRLRDRR